ncbi:CBS domain-containing protein [Paracoccus pacificus]|uniref:CBS domain-containing protein n=1 Tax=Paracoccus pacificus TaxID=1463598 RepID=A0ABW4R410_9RHOB
MLVSQILVMKPAVSPDQLVTITPETTVGEATRVLAEKRIGAVVVSDAAGKLTGILSERDIVRELGRHGPEVLDKPVGELMTKGVHTCHSADDALVVLDRMTQGRFRHLPVVDDSGQMIGIVSIGDAVSARLKELAAEKEALTGMIMGN